MRQSKTKDGSDQIGKSYGRWLIIGTAMLGRFSAFKVRCSCPARTEKVVLRTTILSGGSQSCGCLQAERRIESHTKHGQAHSPEYRVWTHMIGRCYCETDAAYDRYGGRGIKICERWRESFAAFLADMGQRPTPKHTLERGRNDADYSPDNCIWATPAQQARNRRSNRLVELDGRTMHVTDAEARLGICRGSIYQVVRNQGMTYQDAVDRYVARRPHGHA